MIPSSMSVGRETSLQITVFPGGGSCVRARYAYDIEHFSQYLHRRPDQLRPILPEKVAGMMARSFLKIRAARLSFRDESNPITFRAPVDSF